MSESKEPLEKSRQKSPEKKPATIYRNCPTCKTRVADARISIKQSCPSCGTELDFQCAWCYEKFDAYCKLNWHQLSCLSVVIYNCSQCHYSNKNDKLLEQHMVKNKHEGVYETVESVAASDRVYPPLKQMSRFCPTCKVIVVDAKKTTKQPCTKCGTDLIYQCARCKKVSSTYSNLYTHVKAYCKLDCPLCGSPADTDNRLIIHLRTCVNEIHYRCCFCKYMDKSQEVLRRHIATMHKDNLARDCCQDKAEPYECEQCQIKVTICETCRTGFSSTDHHEEHQELCEPPVLECIFCQLGTNGIENFMTHILTHFGASTSQN